ncbi:MAG: ABC transporter ATP-binding protein [Deltaproteobacteria bacterium]|jgi:branched-chain amino acid transport system ATP-binding protein|nr:ABC transporter ATP-binding protein [Deltaproteobacteria bacterium]
MKPLLAVNGVKTFYGNIEALKGISLTAGSGEIIALLGANGAGKTTALKTIVGLTPPGEGQIIYAGGDITGKRPEDLIRKGLVLVPEGRHIFPALTVSENLMMGAFHRADKNEIASDLEYVFKLFPKLKERLNQSGGTLSGGEQQMLAISRGLMGRPKLLLLDEPSLGLAPIIIGQIFETIREINVSQKTTMILVEQNAKLALTVAGRAYIMTAGRVAMSGAAEELQNDENIRRAYLGG